MRGSGSCKDVSIFLCQWPFLPDVPGFQVTSDSVVPSQLRASSRAIPLRLHFHNCSDVFCFIYSFNVPKPFQPSYSHDHRYQFNPCFLQDLRSSPVFRYYVMLHFRLTPVSFSMSVTGLVTTYNRHRPLNISVSMLSGISVE